MTSLENTVSRLFSCTLKLSRSCYRGWAFCRGFLKRRALGVILSAFPMGKRAQKWLIREKKKNGKEIHPVITARPSFFLGALKVSSVFNRVQADELWCSQTCLCPIDFHVYSPWVLLSVTSPEWSRTAKWLEVRLYLRDVLFLPISPFTLSSVHYARMQSTITSNWICRHFAFNSGQCWKQWQAETKCSYILALLFTFLL